MGMKVIIDIPKEAFESVKSDEPIDWLDAMHIISTIQNGIPLSEELEKIKAKINSEDVNCQYEDDYVYSSGLQKAIEIIDNRIEELKGE